MGATKLLDEAVAELGFILEGQAVFSPKYLKRATAMEPGGIQPPVQLESLPLG